MNTREKVRESNRIEGIFNRDPTDEEIEEHDRFVALPFIKIDDMVQFVKVYQPNAELRLRQGLNVRVGSHIPPPGGQGILYALDALLHDATVLLRPAWQIHVRYETLHPFTDGNGRSGRALWYWCMKHQRGMSDLGFLHAFYYQTLENVGRTPR